MTQKATTPKKPMRPLSDRERADSLARTLGIAPRRGAVWIFAYGSLLWNPCFAFEDRQTAILDGYCRAFNFWSVLARGTPERPGLGLGLERDGACEGIAYRLAVASQARDLDALWQREMHSDVYEPVWVQLQTPDGPRHAISFVTNPAHGHYAGNLSVDETARIIAGASGEKGPCRDYLAAAVDALAGHGIVDPALTALLARVRKLSDSDRTV